MDLSKYELSDEVKAQILADHEADTAGLRKNRDDLKAEKEKALGDYSSTLEEKEAARVALVDKEQQLMKAQGDMDGYRASVEAEFAKKEAALNEALESEKCYKLQRDKGDVLNNALTVVHDNFKGAGRAMLEKSIEIEYNDGKANTLFKNDQGEVVAKSVEEFKGWAAEQSDWKHILNGADSSGAGTENGTYQNHSNKMTLTEKALRANKDPLFAAQFINKG